MWDIAKPQSPFMTLPTTNINRVFFGPSSDYLATITSDGLATIWDLRNPQKPVTLTNVVKVRRNIDFSANAVDQVGWATLGENDLVTRWVIAKYRNQPLTLTQATGVRDIEFASQGDILAALNQTDTVTLWGTKPQELDYT